MIGLPLLAGWLVPLAVPFTGQTAPNQAQTGAASSKGLPAVELFDLEGKRLRIQELREPVLVLNLFAFWCDTWIAELPQLRELAAEQRRLNFRLLSISIDGKWTDQLAVVCRDDPLPYPVLVDRTGRLSQAFGVRRIPTILVLDRRRQTVARFEAYPGNPRLLAAIRRAASTGNHGPPTR